MKIIVAVIVVENPLSMSVTSKRAKQWRPAGLGDCGVVWLEVCEVVRLLCVWYVVWFEV